MLREKEKKARAPERNGHRPAEKNAYGLNGYRPSDKEPFMNERQRDYFRAKLLIWKDEILKEARDTLQHLQDENRESPRPRRSRLLGDRPRDRAARARPPAQADRQDRRRDPAHRGRHLRLLRGDRRADRAQAARGAPDRDALDRGAGAPRAARAGLSGRLRHPPERLRFRTAGFIPAVLFWAVPFSANTGACSVSAQACAVRKDGGSNAADRPGLCGGRTFPADHWRDARLHMGMRADNTWRGVHIAIVLVGFVTLAIYGALFRLWPTMKRGALARAILAHGRRARRHSGRRRAADAQRQRRDPGVGLGRDDRRHAAARLAVLRSRHGVKRFRWRPIRRERKRFRPINTCTRITIRRT